MENKYIILSRYEARTNEGIKFTDWFVHTIKQMTKNEANEVIINIKKNYKYIDDKTKLKHEYKLKLYNEYLEEIENKKKKNIELKKKQEEYYKSAEYKELQKKKRQAAKERKEKQEKYKKEHNLI